MRKLTGNYFQKKFLFWKWYKVETIQTTTCPYTFSESPEFIVWETAKDSDLFHLNLI